MTIDLGQITSLTSQIAALQQQAALATDPVVKAILNAQAGALQQQLQTVAQHMQSQAEASANVLDNLQLWSTLNNSIGSLAPTIIGLFRR
jgi:hypothetical protein